MSLNRRALSDNRLDQACADPDYKNLQYNEDGSLSIEPEEGDVSAASFNDQIKIMGNITSGPIPTHSYENMRPRRSGAAEDDDEDYMNDNPEGLDHTYSNHDDLLLQVRSMHAMY